MITAMISIKTILGKPYSYTFFIFLLTACLTFVNCSSGGGSNNAPINPPGPSSSIVNHAAAVNFNSIPDEWINNAKSGLHIAYGHTSHGSQLITGMTALADSNILYSGLDLREPWGCDLGSCDWAANVRAYLDAPNSSTGRGTLNSDVNVIIWSWCGQVSLTATDINAYLLAMNQLENDYPGIKFVYMTGHLDGSGTTGILNQHNEQIRNYCVTNNKILFDFADIESYNPDGVYFLNQGADDGCNYSGGNWATQWITANSGTELTHIATTHCGDCVHSETLNCVSKGRAAWWLWAKLAGWN